ncbi:MAG: SapC-related protein [Betaproteobacteria bacterium]|nr:SapC-related protein [Betaproteobacteria bacterium]
MSSSVFYERAVALNRENHQKLKIEIEPDHYKFAAKTNALPVASTEFTDVARDYPIVFVGEAPGSFHVAALLGLRDNENLFVDDKGVWQAGTYIPAFARRYPFILAGAQEKDRFLVCVDETYAGMNTEKGTALFNDDGKESEYLERVLTFLRAYHAEMQRTAEFANRMAELGLLESKVIAIEKNGQKQVLRGLWMIDEAKLAALDDARVLEFFRAGYLRWIEAHRMSMANVARVAQRLEGSGKLIGDDAVKPATASE